MHRALARLQTVTFSTERGGGRNRQRTRRRKKNS
jgi:hypothetical protein